jgi:hypothetical protein
MSLLLRKACQPLLNSVGISETHVSINDNKRLAIVGQCGQPLITIHGIVFTRKEPTKAEIEYCMELLEEFFDLHIKKILAYMKALQKFKSMPKPNPEAKGYKINIPTPWEAERGEKATITYSDFPAKITLPEDINDAWKLDLLDDVSVDDLTNYTYNRKAMLAAHKHLLDFLHHKTAGENVQDLLAELNKCEI